MMDFPEFKKKFEKIPVEIINSLSQKEPVVSVCIQTYNQANYIQKCIEGVLLQETSFPVEVLLADDDSNDGTRDICRQFAQQYPERIKLFLHSRKNNIKINGFASANFPVLYNLFSARGQYIAMCEGDDFWTDPSKLQKQYEFMEKNPGYSVCYHDYKIVNSNDEHIESEIASPLRKDMQAEELMLAFQHPATLTIFFRNSTGKRIPKESIEVLAIDVFLNSLLGQKGAGKYLDGILPASYRAHEGGLWSKMPLGPKLLSKINTNNKLSRYYYRIGNKVIAKQFQQRNRKIKRYLFFLGLKTFKARYLALPFIKN